LKDKRESSLLTPSFTIPKTLSPGIGISFATVAKGIEPLTGRRLKFIPMSKYFKEDHISVVSRSEKELPPFVENFTTQLLGTKLV